jgi:hypothetical protein
MEYAKYTPTPQTSNIVDFSGLTTDLAKTISGIQKSRDTARTELEAAADVATKDAENPTLTSNRNFNDVILNYSQNGVSQIATWKKDLMNGKITPNDYKSKINNIQGSTSSLSNIAKTWDTKNLEFIKRQSDGTASGLEMDVATMFNGLGDVANSQLFTDNQGKVFHRNTKTGKVMSISALTNVQSTVWNKTDVQGKNKQFADALGKRINWTDQGREGWISIEDVWNSPDNKLAREYHASSILSDPKAAASTLNDAGGIQMTPYTSKEDYDSKLSDLISKTKATFDTAGVPFTDEKEAELKLSMMKMVNDESGNIIPELTQEQNDKARDIVLQNLRAQMDREVKGGAKQVFAPTAPKTGGSGSGGTADKNNTNFYPEMRKAWDTGGTVGGNQLTTLAKGKAKFQFAPGGLKVFLPHTPTRTNPSEWSKEGFIVRDLSAIQKYIYPEGNKNFDIHRQEYINDYGVKSTTPKKTAAKKYAGLDKDGMPIYK